MGEEWERTVGPQESAGLCWPRLLILAPSRSRTSRPPPVPSTCWAASRGGRGQAMLGPWPGLHHQLGGAADAAASSGNPSRAAVLGRLLLRGEVCPWPPARAAQLSRRTEEAPGRLQTGVSGSSSSPGRPPGAPAVTGFLFTCACHGTGCILSAHPAPLQAGLRSREGRGAGPRKSLTVTSQPLLASDISTLATHVLPDKNSK